jgi:hypothetical protein
MVKNGGFRQVVKNSQQTQERVFLGQFQTPLVPERYETRTRQVPDTTAREAKKIRIEKQGLFMGSVCPRPSFAVRQRPLGQTKVKPALRPTSKICSRAAVYSSAVARCSSMRGGLCGNWAKRRR